ncbi:MAG TPA: helix-turn-helix domain-containing protein [Mycobacteriales bacterium]|nr:helix-turn-helix domain-containing protein [Mycobacteriales bacterium]
MLRNVVAIVGSAVAPFELGVVCEIFGIDRTEDGLPNFDFAVCGVEPGPLRAAGGMSVTPEFGLDRARTADLITIPTWLRSAERPAPALQEVLDDAVARGATVLGVCTGAFLLGAAGLLRGRRATCHWRDVERLRRSFPGVRVEPDRLYVEDGPIITSAGTAAGIDACLHVVRRELGAQVVGKIARRMVVPPHRDGGQAQYIETPVPERSRDAEDLAPLLAWLQEHLCEPIDVGRLATRAHMSERTFARRFTAATGTTPHLWLTGQRVLLAQQLLERGDLGIEEIARRTGFRTADVLRHHFSRLLHTSPSAYRRTFAAKD